VTNILRLSDGTEIVINRPTNTSSRSNKNKSGRTSRRQSNSARVLRAVGGTTNLVRAAYHGYDPILKTTNYDALCIVKQPKEIWDGVTHPSSYTGGKGVN
jgi:hypothetical protein